MEEKISIILDVDVYLITYELTKTRKKRSLDLSHKLLTSKDETRGIYTCDAVDSRGVM